MGSGTVLDFETRTRYSLTITATDTAGGTDTADVIIEVLDLREAAVLGTVVIEVGNSGDDYGYETGAFGSLESGQFPGALFGDGNARNVDQIYEDEDGYWYLAYLGGAANAWNDQEHLNEISIDVTCEDGRDARAFVLGGFIEDRNGNTLKLDPPLPSRDWDSRSGEEVAFRFRRHVGQTAPAQAAAIAPPRPRPTPSCGSCPTPLPAGRRWPRPDRAAGLRPLGLQEEPQRRQPAPGRSHRGAAPLGLRDIPDGHAPRRGDQHHEPASGRLRLQVLLRRPGAVLMTTLRKAAVLLLVVHIAAAFVELTRSYYNGYLTGYGMDGWLAFTPIGSHFDLESTDSGSQDVGLQGIETVPRIFQFLFDLGDTVNSLAVVNYDFLGEISSANFLFVLVLALRIFSIGVWPAAAGALGMTVLQSNLLSSKMGLVMLFGGIGILSALGIFF